MPHGGIKILYKFMSTSNLLQAKTQTLEDLMGIALEKQTRLKPLSDFLAPLEAFAFGG